LGAGTETSVTLQSATLSGGTSPLKEWLADAFHRPDTAAYRVTLRVTFFLIILSVLTVIVETAPAIYAPLTPVIDALELVILAAFTAEYVAHVYVAENRRKYILSWWGLIDLLAILPTFLGFFQVRGVTFLRELRVLRVLRMLKLMKVAMDRSQQASAQAAMRRSSLGLDLQIYAICFFTVVVISSTLVYHAEHEAPDSLFTSIPAAMWWSVVTVTTTGYGDYIPQTVIGRIVAGGTMLAGLALFSLLTSVVGRALMTSLFGTATDDPGAGQRRSRREPAPPQRAVTLLDGNAAATGTPIPTHEDTTSLESGSVRTEVQHETTFSGRRVAIQKSVCTLWWRRRAP